MAATLILATAFSLGVLTGMTWMHLHTMRVLQRLRTEALQILEAVR